MRIDENHEIIKLLSKEDKSETIHSNKLLPSFGDDLLVYENSNIKPISCSTVGTRYSLPNTFKVDCFIPKLFMAGDPYFYITEVEVF